MDLNNNSVILSAKVTNGLFWSTIQKWGVRLISFVVFIILTRLLGPEEYGLIALAMIFVGLVNLFIDQGMADAIIQRSELKEKHLDTAFWTNMLVGIVLMVASIALSGWIANLFDEPRLAPVIVWLSLSFSLVALSSTQQALLIRNMDFKSLSLRSIIATLIGGAAGITLASLGFGVWSLVIQHLLTILIGVFILWRISSWRPGFRFSKEHFRELFNFAINVSGRRILDFIDTRLDNFLIGFFLGTTLLGIYSVAYNIIVNLIFLISGVIVGVAFPAFSKLQKEPSRLNNAFCQTTTYTSLLAIPAFIGIVLIAPEMVIVLFGNEWIMSISVVQILAFGGLILSILWFHETLLTSVGKPKWVLGIRILLTSIRIVGFFIGVYFGIICVAIAYVISSYAITPIYLWATKRLINLDIRNYLKQYLVPLIATFFMSLVILGLRKFLGDYLSLYTSLILYITAGVTVYLAIVQLLTPNILKKFFSYGKLAIPRLRNKNS